MCTPSQAGTHQSEVEHVRVAPPVVERVALEQRVVEHLERRGEDLRREVPELLV